MKRLSSLYEEVIVLKTMIDSNFQSQEKVLMPKSPKTQAVVINDYSRKESALRKALNNEDIYNMFVNYKQSEKNKASIQSRH